MFYWKNVYVRVSLCGFSLSVVDRKREKKVGDGCDIIPDCEKSDNDELKKTTKKKKEKNDDFTEWKRKYA